MLVLLFTDLESSTRLWEQHPAEMRPALARHDSILRDAVAEAGGSLVKTTGDGIMATFPSVSTCVTACLHAQRSLASAAWETSAPLRVRMGVHVGEAEAREGDLYGTAVNRAARIMAVGHGGQVLLSALAGQLVRDSMPSGARLRDLGPHRLKDLAEPETLFQLVHPDLLEDFPPLATLDARPNNLPIQVSEFFGRGAELAEARSILSKPGVRLLTLTGPGGTGKTRLALQLGAELAEGFRDGVFLVDLSAEHDPDAAFEAMLRDLGIASTRDGSALQILKTKLADRNMLIVLDNFEQVTEAALGVTELLLHCPDVTILVTSREALRLRGEHVMAVAPLTLPDPRGSLAMIGKSDAVSLFVDRARSVRSDFALTADNAAAVAELSIRLDGLPLAIELAAARLRIFSATDLLDRLKKQFDILGSGPRDLPARQRTLESTIEWSCHLLGPDERRMFNLMSVFSAARLESIEDVARTVHGDIDAIELVASLADKSLVRSTLVGASHRFSMLQTIRDYAAERLESDPDDARSVRLAHAHHFTGYAVGMRRRLEGDDAVDALTEMASELGNLRTAWDHWVNSRDIGQMRRLLESMWVLHDARGWYEGVIELMTDFLDVLGTVEPLPEALEEEMTVRTSLARALMAARGYTAEVGEEFDRVMALSDLVPTSVRRLPVLRALASYHLYLSDFSRAAAVGREIIDQAEQDNDAAGMVEGHMIFGATVAMGGELDLGLGHLKQAIDLFDKGRHPPGRFRGGASPGVVARNALALLLRQGGLPDQAVTRAMEGVALSRTLHHPFSLAYALHHTGVLALQRGRFAEAQSHAIELGALARENDWPVWRALASVVEGVAMCGMGKGAEGIALTEAGNQLYSGLTTPPVFWPGLLGLRGRAFAMAGEPRRALALLEEAILAAGSDEAHFPDLRVVRGDCLSMLPAVDATAVEDSYRAAIRGARMVSDKMTELVATTRLVTLFRTQGRSPDGAEDLAQLLAAFTEGFDEPELIEARAVLSTIG